VQELSSELRSQPRPHPAARSWQPLIAKTVIHYTSVSDSMAVTILGKALDRFDIVEPLLNSGDEKRYGCR